MSKLYWMDQVIATTSGELIDYTVGSSGLIATKVGAAIRELATTMTGTKMSKALAVGATTFSFTNTLFNNNMYIDFYCDGDIEIEDHTYNDTTKTITFKCKALEAACNFRIVVKF